MFYFLATSPAFLLVKLDSPNPPPAARHFQRAFSDAVRCRLLGMLAFALTGPPAFAIVIGLDRGLRDLVRAAGFCEERDAQLHARDAGDTDAVRSLRRLHLGGMLCNAVQLAVILASIPYVGITAT